jgi:putative ABC transport system ATP-binding protein
MKLFSELHESGITIVMITHDANVASNADRIIRIVDGRIYEGTSEEVSV